tara:strand:- start:2282 stop:3424 length:1143 start_codon:yes stop_codon:yes gene_type:complete
MKNIIPFSQHAKIDNNLGYVKKVLENSQTSGDGPFSKKAEKLLVKKLKISGKIYLTTSCTHALEIAAILLNLQPDDEVIVPSYTFVSTALAFYMHKAKIVFADIKPDTLNIDETKLEKLITKKTKAIVAVHYAGVSCEMREIMKLGEKYNLCIIEDNAHGLFGEYYGKKLGSIGHLATQSFHETKNISCGEGGALILNSSKFYSRAEIIREKGTNRSSFIRGDVDKYTWVDKGSSYILSDILSSVLLNQLEASNKIQFRRKEIWKGYNKNLRDWCDKNNIVQPTIPPYCKQSYHMYYLLLPNKKLRNFFLDYLSNLSIKATSHYQPLHSSPFIQKITRVTKDNCPITTDISQRIVRLPLFYNMSNSQYSKVISDIVRFRC